nr:CoA pyrophosphatase [Sphingomicrobium lutaoense]
MRAAIAAPTPSEPSRDDVDPHEEGNTTPAAVLVGIIARREPMLLLTVRAGDMRTHAGQVAFPGGKIDAGETAEEAAVREAQEELGISADALRVLGAIDAYRTGTDFHVTPVVALVDPDIELFPEPAEVAEWFEASLAQLIDPARHRRESVEWRGRSRHYWKIDYEDREIWGATAGMIVNLSHRLRHAL